MKLEVIKSKVIAGEYFFSRHADAERVKDQLTFGQIKEALLTGEILEYYPDTGRGESCLILGFSDNIPIHIVCGWMKEQVVIITVYSPQSPKLISVNPRLCRGTHQGLTVPTVVTSQSVRRSHKRTSTRSLPPEPV